MGRDRKKYRSAVIFEGRDEASLTAQREFDLYVEDYTKRTGIEPKTYVNHKTGAQKFDEFIVILG